jgi:hypothetical protein
MRGKSYFEFHKNWLRNLGIPLRWNRLLQGLGMAVWNGVSHPVKAMQSLARRWGKVTVSKKASAEVRT